MSIVVILKIEDISRKRKNIAKSTTDPRQGWVLLPKIAVQVSKQLQQTKKLQRQQQQVSEASVSRQGKAMSQVQDKNVKLRFSYKARTEIVVLYVTPVPGVSHKADVTLEPWKVDHGWRDVELLLQLSGRPQDLWPFLPIRPHLPFSTAFSTTQLYSTTFSTNLLPATSSLPPAHPPLDLLTTQPPTFLLLQTKSSLCLIERLDFQMLTQKSRCYE